MSAYVFLAPGDSNEWIKDEISRLRKIRDEKLFFDGIFGVEHSRGNEFDGGIRLDCVCFLFDARVRKERSGFRGGGGVDVGFIRIFGDYDEFTDTTKA